MRNPNEVNEIVRMVVRQFRAPSFRLKVRKGSSLAQAQWTELVLKGLCEAAQRLGYSAHAPHPVKDDDKDAGQLLYDTTWCQIDTYGRFGQFIKSVALVAECEWGDERKIKEDFQKLLLANTPVRVMVYDWEQVAGNVQQLVESSERSQRTPRLPTS